MENESLFYVGFYCVFRSTQPTVGIESFIELTLIQVMTFRDVSTEINMLTFCGEYFCVLDHFQDDK